MTSVESNESQRAGRSQADAVERIRATLPAAFVTALGDEAWARLLACYRKPERHYHDLVHLAEVLEVAQRFGVLGTWEFMLAVLYHDAVYEPARTDNEQRSFELVARELLACPRGSAMQHVDTDRVASLVMATAQHATDGEFDAETQALLDCDCAIIGAPRQRYVQYARGVRSEYAHLSDQVFGAGRAAFLRKLSGRQRLFHRAEFEAAFGARARANLDWELACHGVYNSEGDR